MKSSFNRQRSSGFTLIEVMVAMAIVGVTLSAIVLSISSVSDGAARIEETTTAYWIAQNKLQEITLDQKLTKQITKARKADTLEYSDRKWFTSVETIETAVPGMYRYNISVGLDEEHSLATLSGFVNE